MELYQLRQEFSVCKIQDESETDFSRSIFFLAKTDREVSLVCESAFVPSQALAVEGGWKALRIVGLLDFSLVGVIAKISRLLAEAGISLFVVSTYDTDYIFLRDIVLEAAIQILQQQGYTVCS